MHMGGSSETGNVGTSSCRLLKNNITSHNSAIFDNATKHLALYPGPAQREEGLVHTSCLSMFHFPSKHCMGNGYLCSLVDISAFLFSIICTTKRYEATHL